MERVSVIRKTDPPDSRPHVSISNPGPRKVVNRVRTSQSDQTRGAASDGSRGQQFASATRSRGQQLTPSAPARGQPSFQQPQSGVHLNPLLYHPDLRLNLRKTSIHQGAESTFQLELFLVEQLHIDPESHHHQDPSQKTQRRQCPCQYQVPLVVCPD